MCFIPQNKFGIHPLRRFGGYHHGDGDVPFWGYPGLVDQIILIGLMEAGILSVFLQSVGIGRIRMGSPSAPIFIIKRPLRGVKSRIFISQLTIP